MDAVLTIFRSSKLSTKRKLVDRLESNEKRHGRNFNNAHFLSGGTIRKDVLSD